METKPEINNSDNYEEIDNIINQYKTQLEVIKTKTTSLQNNQINNISSISLMTTKEKMNSEIKSSFDISDKNPKLPSNNAYNDNSEDQISLLRSKIISQQTEIQNLTIKLSLIQKESLTKNIPIITTNLNQKEKENNTNNNNNNNVENISILAKLNREYQNIVSLFFEFFNNNIQLYKRAQIVNESNASLITLNENEIEKTKHSANFCINILDLFIKKLMNDNTEMFNQLVKYKEIAENDNGKVISNQNLKDLKLENMLLKQQLAGLVEKMSQREYKDKENNKMEIIERKPSSFGKIVKKKNTKKRGGSCFNNNHPKMNSSNYSSFNNSNKNQMDEPIKKLKLRIKDLECKIKGELKDKEIDNEE